MQEMSGYMYTKGKYIAFFDSDDYIEKNMYKEMMDKTLEYEYDINASNGAIIKSSSEIDD